MFPLHPQLFQVKCHGQQEQLGADIGLASGEKAAETKVIFQQGKSPLHLNGPAQAQVDATLRGEALGGFRPFLPESLLEAQLLGLIGVLGPTALAAAGTASAVLTPVPGGGDKLAVPDFCTLSPQGQFSALGTGETVLFQVVGHVFYPADLFPKLFALLLVRVAL